MYDEHGIHFTFLNRNSCITNTKLQMWAKLCKIMQSYAPTTVNHQNGYNQQPVFWWLYSLPKLKCPFQKTQFFSLLKNGHNPNMDNFWSLKYIKIGLLLQSLGLFRSGSLCQFKLSNTNIQCIKKSIFLRTI